MDEKISVYARRLRAAYVGAVNVTRWYARPDGRDAGLETLAALLLAPRTQNDLDRVISAMNEGAAAIALAAISELRHAFGHVGPHEALSA